MAVPRYHYFEVRASDDSVKRDRELACPDCEQVICDIEPGDTLQVLLDTASMHVCGVQEEADA